MKKMYPSASLRPLWRSCSFLIRRGLCGSSIYNSSAVAEPRTPALVQQFPEPAKERVLRLAELFESSRKPSPGLRTALGQFRDWASENNEPATSKNVDLLFTMCFRTGNVSDVELVIKYAERHGIKFSDGQMNAMLASIVRSGDYARTLEVWQKMETLGTELRLSGLCAMLEAATNERDFPTMLKLAKQLQEFKGVLIQQYSSIRGKDGGGRDCHALEDTLKYVLQACVGVDSSVAMETSTAVIDVLRIIRRKLSREMLPVVTQWVESSEQLSCEETIINYSGECSGCGLTLGVDDVTPDELQMLRRHIEAMLQGVIRQSESVRSQLDKLDLLRRMVNFNDFGAILDGMNVAHAFHKVGPSRKQLFQIATEAIDVTGKPVLILMRKHCVSWFTAEPPIDKTIAEVSKLYQDQGIHCFFTRNYDEDDLYLVYATMYSKPSTYLITNDLQGCIRKRLPNDCIDIFQQWLRRRLAGLVKIRRQAKINFPSTYDDCLQWDPPNSGSSWKNLHIPLDFRRRWLCITREKHLKTTQQ